MAAVVRALAGLGATVHFLTHSAGTGAGVATSWAPVGTRFYFGDLQAQARVGLVAAHHAPCRARPAARNAHHAPCRAHGGAGWGRAAASGGPRRARGLRRARALTLLRARAVP